MLHRIAFTLTAPSLARRLAQRPGAIVSPAHVNYGLRPFTAQARTEMTASRRSARLSASSADAKAADAAAAMPPPKTTASAGGRKRKAAAATDADNAPTTPKKKKIIAPPPLTPTPSAVGIMSEPYRGEKPKPAAVSRLAALRLDEGGPRFGADALVRALRALPEGGGPDDDGDVISQFVARLQSLTTTTWSRLCGGRAQDGDPVQDVALQRWLPPDAAPRRQVRRVASGGAHG